ncbi:hypothetical protein EPR50_G00038760 [Perca flavescens]|uniref:Uncharacterized protein n=1 Tax=Perca flavescens TaxID=8167 RepID=A0A484DEM5_PERFV|nr:hypothetical protein EPR50_G00038760 [Perca flavescens]
MSGANGKKGPSSGVMEWIGSACRFATDRNDFRRNLLVNLGLFAAARNITWSKYITTETRVTVSWTNKEEETRHMNK